MARLLHAARQPLKRAEVKADMAEDFNDPESRRVLTAAARAVARELGREAAREYFADLIGRTGVSK